MKNQFYSLTTALMAASTLWLGALPGRSQDVAISAAEFQRMVYSGHLLTVMDEKPELDACLQVLLELQRRNPNADPATLANVLRQALGRFRTNAPAYVRIGGYRDEVLAAYLEAFRQVPARTNFVQANLRLLQQFMLSPDDYTNASPAELIHSSNQRLLSSEGEAGKRLTLVDACIGRAQGNPAFALAMDSLLVTNETSVSLYDSPSAIIGNTNSALNDSQTMQTLLSLSLGSGDGSLTVSSNQLMNLFSAETQVLWDTINTNLALETEFNQSQPDLLAYLGNAAAIQAREAHVAQVQEGQTRKIASATAAILVQTKLQEARLPTTGPLPKLPKWLRGTAEGLSGIAKAAAAMEKGSKDKTPLTKLGKASGALTIVTGALSVWDMFDGDEGESPDEQIVREIGNMQTLIKDLSVNNTYRFDRVDDSLVTIFDTLNTEFTKLEIGQTALGLQITNIAGNVNEIRNTLVNVQTDLHRLERNLNAYVLQLYGRGLNEAFNTYLGYEKTHLGSTMSSSDFILTPEPKFFTLARNNSVDDLSARYTGRNYTPAGLNSELTESGGGATNRLDQNLSYIKKYLKDNFNLDTGGTLGELANPRDWFVGAYAYLQLSFENPNYFRGINPSTRLDLISARGRDLTNFFRSLTFNGSTINGPLYNALTNYYAASLPPFTNQVQATEQQHATSINFALNTWRQWSAAAPRVTTSATTLSIAPEPLPLIPREKAIRIAGGLNHSLAVKSDGTVVAWGFNGNGQINVPPGLNNVVDVAGGGYHSLALNGDGTIVGWGSDGNGETTPPASATGVTAIAAGVSHNLALKGNGTVVGWGENTYGQTNSPASATNVIAIASGGYHSLALRTDGTLVAWGAGTNNTGASSQYGQAIVPPGLAGVTQVAGGLWHSLALKQDGTVVAWGHNLFGQTNVPPSTTNVMAIAAGNFHSLVLKSNGTVLGWGGLSQAPTKIPIGLTNVIAIAAGDSHSLALKADGTVVVWGDISLRQCVVPAALTWRGAIAPGATHMLALKADGTVLAWGANGSGQTNIPSSATDVVAVAAGDNHSLALKADGTVIGWGLNNRGQTNTPPSAINVVAIAAGRAHSLALKADGTIEAWGGFNASEEKNIPASATNVVAIAAGGGQSLALKADGTVIGWGKDGGGFFTLAPVPAGLSNVVAIAASGNNNGNSASCLALKADGTIVGWGNNDYGQISIPPNATDVVGIAAGGYHSLALRADTTVVAWGDISPAGASDVVTIAAGVGYSAALTADGALLQWNNGRITIPAGLTSVKAIAAGDYHALALKPDRTVTGWGYNDYGQLNIPAGLTNVEAIAAGTDHSLALKADGTVVGWGNNGAGQLNIIGHNNVVAIAAGRLHSLTLKADGMVLGWGSTTVPASATNVVAIAAGRDYDLALNADGTVIRWGSDSVVPASATNVVAIAVGFEHSLVLRSNGTLVAWGNNNWGQINIPPSATNVVAISAGAYHNLALKADGSVVAWGAGLTNLPDGGTSGFEAGQSIIPSGTTNVVAIAAGRAYSLFLKSSSGSTAGQNLSLVRAQIPRRVGSLFQSVNANLLATLQPFGSNSTNAFALSGPKALLTAVLELGLPYTLERDDVLRGFLYGNESLVDLTTAQTFLQDENEKLQASPETVPQTLGQAAVLRYERFVERLNQRLLDLQATGQPEIPRLVGHTLRLINLLRDSWASVPPSSLELISKTNGFEIVLYGEPYAQYKLQQSADLNSWTDATITNLRSADSPLGIVNTNLPVASVPARFYRASQSLP